MSCMQGHSQLLVHVGKRKTCHFSSSSYYFLPFILSFSSFSLSLLSSGSANHPSGTALASPKVACVLNSIVLIIFCRGTAKQHVDNDYTKRLAMGMQNCQVNLSQPQWRNRWGGGGRGNRVPPQTSNQEISAHLPRKKRLGEMEKGENGEEKKENCEREGEKLKM